VPEPQLIGHIREAIEWAAIGIEILGLSELDADGGDRGPLALATAEI
jgi:hypothetical protein